MAISTLLIGCGNIGARYDLETGGVWTYAKALAQHPEVELTVTDVLLGKAALIAELYNVSLLEDPQAADLSSYDLVCIASPTSTHVDWLRKLVSADVSAIVCEKPITLTRAELEEARRLVSGYSGLVWVNYPRRFQPSYVGLRANIGARDLGEPEEIRIRYQRGLFNNATHGFDTAAFLLNQSLSLDNIVIQNVVRDAFENDPTVSFSGKSGATEVIVTGLLVEQEAIFDIHFEWSDWCLDLRDRGSEIIWRVRDQSGGVRGVESKDWGALRDYMLPVVDRIVGGFKTPESTITNWEAALETNEVALKIADMLTPRNLQRL
ncbi:MAG: Gfo/Idh/MocA family oxidoreductase [Myxococcota bacterium]|nr:Gfo/Idh/MocA family oxidoreductase [Myxococcota bacterium]